MLVRNCQYVLLIVRLKGQKVLNLNFSHINPVQKTATYTRWRICSWRTNWSWAAIWFATVKNGLSAGVVWLTVCTKRTELLLCSYFIRLIDGRCQIGTLFGMFATVFCFYLIRFWAFVWSNVKTWNGTSCDILDVHPVYLFRISSIKRWNGGKQAVALDFSVAEVTLLMNSSLHACHLD